MNWSDKNTKTFSCLLQYDDGRVFFVFYDNEPEHILDLDCWLSFEVSAHYCSWYQLCMKTSKINSLTYRQETVNINNKKKSFS